MFAWNPGVFGEGADEVMRRVEANQSVPAEMLAFEMVLTDRTGFQRRRQVREFRRRSDAALEDSLIFFDDPPDIRGSSLLSKERADGMDDQWLFLPAVGKIRRIADSGRTDYFLGTDLTFEDLSVEDIDRFSYSFAATDTWVGDRRAHVIDAVSADSVAARRSGYSRRRVFVDVERYLILKAEYVDRAGKSIKVLEASGVERFGNVWRAGRIFVDNYARKHKTHLAVLRRSLPESLPADLFTPRTLQRASVPEIFSRPLQTTPGTP